MVILDGSGKSTIGTIHDTKGRWTYATVVKEAEWLASEEVSHGYFNLPSNSLF